MELEIRVPVASELGEYFALRAQAFAIPGAERDAWIAGAEPDTLLAAFDRGRMVGGLRVIPLGQWFGGRCLTMAGIAGVVVAPEARGRGVASRLLARALADQHELGTHVSSLHPATTRLYRAAGWEIAGDFATYRVETRSLARLPRGEPERLRRLSREDWPWAQECHARAAALHTGWVHRSPAWWEVLAEQRFADQRYVYGVEGDDGDLDGYLSFAQENRYTGWGYALAVHETVSLTPEANATLWSFLGSHAMQVEHVEVPSAVVGGLLLLLPEQDVRRLSNNRWMHRLVDAPAALAARGYPEVVAAEVHLEIADPIAPWNAGRHVVRFEDGRAVVEPGGTGEVQLGIGALSALFAGRCSAGELAAAGVLRHASARGQRALDAAFAGPAPEILDDF
jgi:predicted acetyltransferase